MTDQDKVLAFLSEDLEAFGAAPNPFYLGGKLFDSAMAFLRTHGCQYRTLVRDTLAQAYDKHVAPIDLPGIPNFLEPQVDEGIKRAILGLYDRAAEEFCNPANTPTEDIPPVRPGA